MPTRINKILHNNFFQKSLIVIMLILVWEMSARLGWVNQLLLPGFTTVGETFADQLRNGNLYVMTMFSLLMIVKGMLISLIMALILSSLAMMFHVAENLVNVLNSIFHPLPGIALLPIAMLWFGLSEASIIFIIVHSVVWPLVINFLSGFRSIPTTIMEAGRNIGLKRVGLIWGVMLPAAAPYLISGIKIGWARAWQAAIAGEMVFGAVGTIGGLGWYIFKTRYDFNIAGTFAALLTIMVVGILIEEVLFKSLEKATVKKWGMSI